MSSKALLKEKYVSFNYQAWGSNRSKWRVIKCSGCGPTYLHERLGIPLDILEWRSGETGDSWLNEVVERRESNWRKKSGVLGCIAKQAYTLSRTDSQISVLEQKLSRPNYGITGCCSTVPWQNYVSMTSLNCCYGDRSMSLLSFQHSIPWRPMPCTASFQ